MMYSELPKKPMKIFSSVYWEIFWDYSQFFATFW